MDVSPTCIESRVTVLPQLLYGRFRDLKVIISPKNIDLVPLDLRLILSKRRLAFCRKPPEESRCLVDELKITCGPVCRGPISRLVCIQIVDCAAQDVSPVNVEEPLKVLPCLPTSNNHQRAVVPVGE